MSAILFFIAAIGAIAGAVGVVVLRNPFYSVLALVSHLISLALLFLLLQAQFIAAAQVIVYAGAVMVLYVFVVAYVGGGEEPASATGGRSLRPVAIVFAAALFVELSIAVLGTGLSAVDTRGVTVDPSYGSPEEIGKALLTTYLLPFELCSFLLLIAAVGAVALARRRRGMEDDPATVSVHDVFTMGIPAGLGSQAESVGGHLVAAPTASVERDVPDAPADDEGKDR
jgi:NADH-quinone oxidoreductase subunit J